MRVSYERCAETFTASPAVLLAGDAVRTYGSGAPIPAAAEKGSPEGLVPLALAAQARVQGRALPLAAQADVTAKFGARESKNRGDRT